MDEVEAIIDKPIEVTDATFKKFAAQHKLVLMDFWAGWCAPCRVLSPIIEEMAREYKGRIIFGKLNVDENPETAAKFEIRSIPTLLIIRNGEVVDRIIGVAPKQYIETKLQKHA